MSFDQLDRLPDFRPLALIVSERLPQDDVHRSIGPLQHRREHDVELPDEEDLQMNQVTKKFPNFLRIKLSDNYSNIRPSSVIISDYNLT
jgi:hypothetical protein